MNFFHFPNIKSVHFIHNLFITFFSVLFNFLRSSVLSSHLLLLLTSNSLQFLHNFSFRVIFMLMTFTSLLHFLKKSYLLQFLKIAFCIGISLGVILCSSNSLPEKLVSLTSGTSFFNFYRSFHSPFLSLSSV